jgi:serine/threonine-protein kinase
VGEGENGYARRVIGRYRLYDVIAAGGMATVHYARMHGPMGFARTVAVKRLHAEYARDPEFVAMFLDEARLAARVRHPNVVQTLDVVSDGGELFLVMEYVPGASLAQLLRAADEARERVPPQVAVAVALGVLAGLHAAHEACDEDGNPLDLVHRDVSPQNILVGGDGAARVLDFGIAKAAGRATQATREGQVKGKFAYMAPEQVTNVLVSRQADVFAASVVLWEALTGARLFHAESEPAVLARVLTGAIAPPSAVASDVSSTLDEVVLRGLARDLAVRYATAQEMARALESNAVSASALEVGEWVQRLVGRELDERAGHVARIESESRVEGVRAHGPSNELSNEPSSGPSSELPSEASTDLPSTSPSAHDSRTRRRRRLATLAGAAVGLAGLAGSLFWSGVGAPRAADTHGESTPSTSLLAPPMAVSAVPLPTQTDPTDVATTAAPSTSSRADRRKGTTRPSAVPPRPSQDPGRMGNAARPSRACDPPYYVDSYGHLIYKPECFR